MRVAFLLAWLLVGMSLPAGQSAPDASVQGVGATTFVYDCIDAGPRQEPIVITVEHTPAGPKATLYWENLCFLFLLVFPLSAGNGLAFNLEGDWERGFVGRTPLGVGVFLHSTISIGPYGDGSSIQVRASLGCCLSSTESYFEGVISDANVA